MKYEIIDRRTRCRVEVEATSPARAVAQTPWPYEICEIHLMGVLSGSRALGVDRNPESWGDGRIARPELETL